MKEKILQITIEIPKWSRNKYEYDQKSKRIVLDRVLAGSMVYPENYGFLDQTIDYDGDPLDVICLSTEPVFPGCLVNVRVIGVLKMIDQNEVDDKIIAVSANDPFFSQINELSSLAPAKLLEISNFFSRYKELEKKEVSIEGFFPKDDALLIIDNCEKNFLEVEKQFGKQQPEKQELLSFLKNLGK